VVQQQARHLAVWLAPGVQRMHEDVVGQSSREEQLDDVERRLSPLWPGVRCREQRSPCLESAPASSSNRARSTRPRSAASNRRHHCLRVRPRCEPRMTRAQLARRWQITGAYGDEQPIRGRELWTVGGRLDVFLEFVPAGRSLLARDHDCFCGSVMKILLPQSLSCELSVLDPVRRVWTRCRAAMPIRFVVLIVSLPLTARISRNAGPDHARSTRATPGQNHLDERAAAPAGSLVRPRPPCVQHMPAGWAETQRAQELP
jgi:hypothetical protein